MIRSQGSRLVATGCDDELLSRLCNQLHRLLYNSPFTVSPWSHPPSESSYSQYREQKSRTHRANNVLGDVSAAAREEQTMRCPTSNDVDETHGCLEVAACIQT